jgi:hypothetical protein
MSEMKHPTAEHLEEFVEGALPARERVVVELHLPGCPSCQGQVEELRSLFTALSTLTHFEPAEGFAERVMVIHALENLEEFVPSAAFGERVMASVRIPQGAWQRRAAWAGALITRAGPKSSFGWAMAAAMLGLPMLLGGGTVAWLLSRSYVTSSGLIAMATTWLIEGLQGMGSTAVSAIMRTDLAVWTATIVTEFMARAGLSGLGVVAATAAGAITLSIWILYKNLFRTPSREAHYVSYSF